MREAQAVYYDAYTEKSEQRIETNLYETAWTRNRQWGRGISGLDACFRHPELAVWFGGIELGR